MRRNYVFYCRTSHLSLLPLPLSTRAINFCPIPSVRASLLTEKSRMFARSELPDSHATRWCRRWKKINDKNERRKRELLREGESNRCFLRLAPAFQLLCLTWFMVSLACRIWKGLFFPGQREFRAVHKFEIKSTYWKRSLKDEFACASIYSGTIRCKLQFCSWIFKSVRLIEKLNEFLKRNGLFKSVRR